MAAPGTTRSGVGFRHCQILLLNSSGTIAATSATVYEGVQLSGAKAMTIDDPEPRDIIHIGDDRVFQRDVLPPDTPISGEIRTGKVNDAVDDVITDDKGISTVGEAMLFGFGTNNRGDENQVCVLAYRQTLDTVASSSSFGRRRWEGRLFPKAYLIPRESGFEDTPEERVYTLRPLFVTAYPWGLAFVTGTEGFTQAQGFRLISEYKPKIVGWAADGSTTDFVFPTTDAPQATTKVETWVNGVLQTDSFTVYSTQIVFSTAITSDLIVVAFYEYE